MEYVWIALGSALGGVGRVLVADAVSARAGAHFPYGTLVVNVLGSFAIGVVAAFLTARGRSLLDGQVGRFLVLGLFGGFTTFSAFSLQTFALLRAGAWLQALVNAMGSVLLCLLAVAVGHGLGGRLAGLWPRG